MTWFSTFILGILQGITEFLPISSSAHLILVPQLLEWADQSLAFDVAVHIGTLLAVIFYFKKPLSEMTKAFLKTLCQRSPQTKQSQLAFQLMLATIPVGLVGLLCHDFVATNLRSNTIISIALIGFGLLLGFSDSRWIPKNETTTLTWKNAFLIGCAQTLALIPGTSRSGVTMTAALLLGLDRAQAATFSFLLSIPVISLAGGYETFKLLQAPSTIPWSNLCFGALFSFISALLCIHLFLKFVQKIGMLPFVVYRLLLGGLLLGFFIA